MIKQFVYYNFGYRKADKATIRKLKNEPDNDNYHQQIVSNVLGDYNVVPLFF